MGSSGSQKNVETSMTAIATTEFAFSHQPMLNYGDHWGGKLPQLAGQEDGILRFSKICERVDVHGDIDK